jgi:hypothetical protein
MILPLREVLVLADDLSIGVADEASGWTPVKAP